jgi:hypothetical protein
MLKMSLAMAQMMGMADVKGVLIDRGIGTVTGLAIS